MNEALWKSAVSTAVLVIAASLMILCTVQCTGDRDGAGQEASTPEGMTQLADVAYADAEYEKAERLYRNALEIQIEQNGEVHPSVVESLNNLGLALQALDRLEEAEACYKRNLELCKQVYGEDQHSADGNSFLGSINIQLDLYHRAEAYAREALRLRRTGFPDDHELICSDLINLGDALLWQKKYAAADSAYGQALAISRAALPSDRENRAAALLGKGQSLAYMGDAIQAEPLIREGLTIREEHRPDDWQTYDARSHLGFCLTHLGRYREAEELLAKTYAVTSEERGPRDRHTRRTARRLADLYEAWGKPELYAHYSALAGDRRVR